MGWLIHGGHLVGDKLAGGRLAGGWPAGDRLSGDRLGGGWLIGNERPGIKIFEQVGILVDLRCEVLVVLCPAVFSVDCVDCPHGSRTQGEASQVPEVQAPQLLLRET